MGLDPTIQSYVKSLTRRARTKTVSTYIVERLQPLLHAERDALQRGEFWTRCSSKIVSNFYPGINREITAMIDGTPSDVLLQRNSNSGWGHIQIAHALGECNDGHDAVLALIDWLNMRDISEKSPNINKFNISEAYRQSAEWHASLEGKRRKAHRFPEDLGGRLLFLEFDDGYAWYELLSRHCLAREGYLMGHCVGGFGYPERVEAKECRILSLRDVRNFPCLTVEVAFEEIVQVKGRFNQDPSIEYQNSLERLIENCMTNGVILRGPPGSMLGEIIYEDETDDEPSMEQILASIRRIINDDDDDDDEITEWAENVDNEDIMREEDPSHSQEKIDRLLGFATDGDADEPSALLPSKSDDAQRNHETIKPARKHIMILDDDASSCALFEDRLRSHFDNLTVSKFSNKIEGMTEAYQAKVDLFLTDIISPDMSGIDFLRWVRSDQQFHSIPVVVCSAIASSKSAQLGLIAAGASDAMYKSTSAETFLEIIEANLQGVSGAWPESETSKTSIVLTSETDIASATEIKRWWQAGLHVVDIRFDDDLSASQLNSLRDHVMLGAVEDGGVWNHLSRKLRRKHVEPLKYRDPFDETEFGNGENYTFVQYLARHIIEAFDGIREALGDRSLMQCDLPRPVRRAAEHELLLIADFSQRLPSRLKETEPDVPWAMIENLSKAGPLLHLPKQRMWEDLSELLRCLENGVKHVLDWHLLEIADSSKANEIDEICSIANALDFTQSRREAEKKSFVLRYSAFEAVLTRFLVKAAWLRGWGAGDAQRIVANTKLISLNDWKKALEIVLGTPPEQNIFGGGAGIVWACLVEAEKFHNANLQGDVKFDRIKLIDMNRILRTLLENQSVFFSEVWTYDQTGGKLECIGTPLTKLIKRRQTDRHAAEDLKNLLSSISIPANSQKCLNRESLAQRTIEAGQFLRRETIGSFNSDLWSRSFADVEGLMEFQNRHPCIITIESNELQAKLYQDLFWVLLNCVTINYNNPKEFLNDLDDLAPDLIISDISLPEISGMEVAKIVRENGKLDDVPLVACTAFAMKGDREKVLAGEFDHYFSKPINVKEFISGIVGTLQDRWTGLSNG